MQNENQKQNQDTADLQGFLDNCRRVGGEVLSWQRVLVVHHHDCDGLSSAGSACLALRNSQVEFDTLVLKRLDEEGVAQAKQKAEQFKARGILFTDLGSGQLSLLEPLLANFRVAVIDHHVPQKEISHSNFFQANPHLQGFDGGVSACSASMCYFCFRDYCPGLQQLGIVGAVGDMQEARGFVGLNKLMLEDGVKQGVVAVKKDLRLFGRRARSLVSFLCYSSEPFLPGLTGDDKACAHFLEEVGLLLQRDGKWLAYNDLPKEEKMKLVSALAIHLQKHGVEEEVAVTLVGDVYEFPKEDFMTELYDASEYSTLLNAVGRHGQARLGVNVCLREPGAFESARSVLEEHRRAISAGVQFAKKNYNDLGEFYVIDARGAIGDTVIGTVVGSFLGSGLVARTKPVVGLSTESLEVTKASSRGTKELIEKGLDLNTVMRSSAESVGGLGGGHKVAAGASFPAGKEKEFLQKCRQVVQSQIAV